MDGASTPRDETRELKTAAAVPRWPRLPAGGSAREWAGVGAAVGLVAAVFGFAWLLGPHPDATLRPIPGEAAEELSDFLLGIEDYDAEIDFSSFQRYESFRGVETWSAVDAYGSPCLVVIQRSSRALMAVVCTPPEADLLADIEAWPALDEDFAEGLPDGSVIRFHFRGDSVDAFVHRSRTSD